MNRHFIHSWIYSLPVLLLLSCQKDSSNQNIAAQSFSTTIIDKTVIITDIEELANHNYLVAGYHVSPDGEAIPFYFLEVDPTGKIIFDSTITYCTSANEILSGTSLSTGKLFLCKVAGIDSPNCIGNPNALLKVDDQLTILSLYALHEANDINQIYSFDDEIFIKDESYFLKKVSESGITLDSLSINFRSITKLKDGNFVLTTSDGLTKINSTLNVLWQKEMYVQLVLGLDDSCFAAILVSDSLVKLDADGKQIWGVGLPHNATLYPLGLLKLSNGNILYVNTDYDMIVYDPAGNLVKNYTLTNLDGTDHFAIKETSDGGWILVLSNHHRYIGFDHDYIKVHKYLP